MLLDLQQKLAVQFLLFQYVALQFQYVVRVLVSALENLAKSGILLLLFGKLLFRLLQFFVFFLCGFLNRL